MIVIATQLPELRARIGQWRREGKRVGFVPTMGNLHAGHYALIALARQHADCVVASIFVNPTQFGPNEDFGRYPRTPESDQEGLASAGCDLVWMPSVETMYPHGVDATVRVSVPIITDMLEGASRPGHFDGVATVVAKLFNQVQPDIAVFGRKDYQQLAVVRYLVGDMGLPVEIIAGETLREADGLAMSSRNQYLSTNERPTAATIHRTLQQMRSQTLAGNARLDVERAASQVLRDAGFIVDYAVVRRPDLSDPEWGEGGPQVALIAARLGRTRLIDNIAFDPGNWPLAE
ncbi:MAG: panC [Xanthomonadaceae bacterium]|nr:panC [Xanthomonadaceae bacterium]